MPAIPRTHQYYPSVPLSELSDLYSKGDNRLNNQRACIISFLPKTLRISKDLPFNNRYFFFIENTPNVTAIAWSHKLYLNGEVINNNTFLIGFSDVDHEYIILSLEDVIDVNGRPLFDKLRVTCTVSQGAGNLTLTVEHNLINALSAKNLPGVSVIKKMTMPFTGHRGTTDYIINHLRDYLPKGEIVWNKNVVHNGVLEDDALLKIVTAILYHNILRASKNNPGTHFFSNADFEYDIFDYTDAGIKSLLNESTDYEGEYKNGFCLIPIHILNDILPNIAAVPDFTAMDAGAGNPVFNILRDSGLMTYNDLTGDVLRTVPQQIQDSKLRISNDIPRFVELFNLTLFPKSAIVLTAIVIKYLFECSKKNNCNECKNSSPLWPVQTFDGLKDHPDFLKNVLTHYFREPSNKIESFATEAKKTSGLTWNPAVYTILNVTPRFVKAYFAKKIVKQIDGHYVFDFEKIDDKAIRVDANGIRLPNQPTFDSLLGKEVYIVVETLYARNQELTLNVQPINNVLTGNTNDLELRVGTGNNYETDLLKIVGNYDHLRNNVNADFTDPEKELFKIDHIDKAIIKVRLKPSVAATFESWTNNLQTNATNLRIVARLSSNANIFFGSDVSTPRLEDEFLSANDKYLVALFRIENRIVYEIFHGTNLWNFQSMMGALPRRVGRIDNLFIEQIADASPIIASRKVIFYYRDQLDNEHLVTECRLFKPRRRNNGVVLSNTTVNNLIPAGHTSNAAAPAGGDAFWNYYYGNGDVVTVDNPQPGDVPRNSGASGVPRDYGIVRYPVAGNNANDVVEVIRMPDTLAFSFIVNQVDQQITYAFSNTQRRCANPGCFAAFLGILAQLNYNNVQSTGMCFEDGTSYPSVSHPNGDSIDTVYLETQLKRRAIIAAFKEWEFTQVISGTDAMHNGDGADLHSADHNSHLHSGNFDLTSVEDIIL